jgi:nicotinate-nucleotide--dimethylbenzimidazole phosphoribosyltransferase
MTILSMSDIQAHLDGLAKPPGSLGKLENIAARLSFIQQSLQPQTHPRRLVLFAADHGVVASGVSAWPSNVTAVMIQTIASGRAASTILGQTTDTDVHIVDVGSMDCTISAPHIPYRKARIANGTKNLAIEAAMTPQEFDTAWAVGVEEAQKATGDGVKVIAAGEMGIGNTTAAACLTALLANTSIEKAVGRGAGADDTIFKQKIRIVKQATERAQRHMNRDAKAAIASVCGFEIAAMAGFYTQAHKNGLTIVLDGYVTTAAALIAQFFMPTLPTSMLAAHQSAEPGHKSALKILGLSPLLEWGMRLGEGTGALMAMPQLDCAAAILSRMATLAEVLE